MGLAANWKFVLQLGNSNKKELKNQFREEKMKGWEGIIIGKFGGRDPVSVDCLIKGLLG